MGIYEQISEKRKILRGEYGGMMSACDLARELSMNRHTAKEWGIAEGVGVIIGKRIKFDTDAVAKRIVEIRGMC